MPGKTECLRIEGDKPQINAVPPVHLQRVEQIIFVIVRSDCGKRAYKPLQKQRNIVFKDIDFPENLVQELLDTVAGEYFIHTGCFAAFDNPFFRLRLFAIINRFNLFPFRNRQNSRTDIECIDKINQEIKLARLSVFFRFRMEIVHRKDHLLILIVLKIVMITRVIAFT